MIFKRSLKKPRLIYILIAILDSQGNFLNIYAFSVIHFNYAFIINISSVFWTCLLTWLLIKRYTYKFSHIFGISFALCGVAATLYGSMSRLENEESILSNVKGLCFCLAASLLYSLSSVVQELTLKSGQDIYEMFPWLGLIGMVITLIEAFFLGEYKHIANNDFIITYDVILYLLGFAATLVVFTSISPFFIKRCSASMFNISLVSQIFWSYIVEIIFNETTPKTFIYYIGFVVIILGIFIFNRYPDHDDQSKDPKILNEESFHSLILQKDNSQTINTETKLNMKNPTVNDHFSESSSCSGFSSYKYYKHSATLSSGANKILNN
jgi:drug/metabolite transporter (DMT)-like permease